MKIYHQTLKEHISILNKITNDDLKILKQIINLIKKTIISKKKIIICGNGGSAADSMHMVAELIIKFKKKRKPYPAISLSDNNASITACGNDFSFDEIFERQIEGIGNRGDLLWVMTTSGNSENILRAIKKAKELKIKTVGILGNQGGKAKKLLDICLIIKSKNVARVQEVKLMLNHIICQTID